MAKKNLYFLQIHFCKRPAFRPAPACFDPVTRREPAVMPPSRCDDASFLAVKIITVIFTGAFLLVLFLLCTREPAPAPSQPAVGRTVYGGYGGQGVAVLLFHAVGGASAGPDTISPEDLEATFQLLKDCGYVPIDLNRFHDFLEGKAGVPARAVLLTFDDGYRDVYEYALPLTEKYRFPAVAFAVTKWFDPYPRPEASRSHLSAGEAKELLVSGLWQIAGHSYEGHRLAAGPGGVYRPYLLTRTWKPAENRFESEAEYKARVWSDIVLDRAALKRIGVAEPLDFAYPYGAPDPGLIQILKEAGYVYLYTNEPGLNKPGQDPSRIFRITAGRHPHETMALLAWYFSSN
ncbi:hypothetical protein PTH_2643 [Pelotomaculum thermopropionicum SI]|uniref:NodB homology domain-containing protein n=1 Tax=Pelotomaculum thermopropionicum (strain DSM 13744 / JCM 10971 / SI) TaxID=370438 RepID=A5CYU2_PELTS|nr:hypothetical protein PTH_2643 [Pelotomaculum thermopropionicum SI]